MEERGRDKEKRERLCEREARKKTKRGMRENEDDTQEILGMRGDEKDGRRRKG